MQRFYETVFDTLTGAAISGAEVWIWRSSDNGLASLFSTSDGMDVQTNPMVSDSNGLVDCYVGDGIYNVEFKFGGISLRTIDNVAIFDLADIRADLDGVMANKADITYVDAQDAAEASARGTAIAAEATARTNADSALNDAINALSANVYTKTQTDAAIAAGGGGGGAWGSITGTLGDQTDLATALSGKQATGLALLKASNLSDLADKAVSRTNLDVYSKAEVQAAIISAENVQPTATGPSGQTFQGGPSAHQYWRGLITGINGSAQPVVLAEVQFREVVGTAQVPSGGAAVYSSTSGGNGPGAVFDGNTGTVWQSAAQPTPAAPQYIGYNYGVGVTKAINQIALTNTPNGAFGHVAPLPAEESPTDFTVQWSDDGVTWTTEWTITGIAWTGSPSQTLVFTHPRAGQAVTAYQNYPTKLAALNDVDITTTPPTDGQALEYNAASGKWKPATLPVSTGGGSSPAGTLSIPQLAPHRYWKVQFNYHVDFATSLAELQMRSTVGGANICTGGTAIFSAQDAGNPATNAFDSNVSNYWSVTQGGSGVSYDPQWIGYDFGAGNAKVVQEVAITARNGSPAQDQTPKQGSLLYSDDGVNYFTAFGWDDGTTYGVGETRVKTSPWAASAGIVGMTAIATITVAGTTTTSIDFASIPGAYKHLAIVGQGRSLTAGATDDVLIAINGDTTNANYTAQQLQGNSTSVSAASNPGSMPRHFGSVAGATATAGQAGDFDYKIPNYATTTFIKQWQGRNGLPGFPLLKDVVGKWNATTAVNEVTLTLNSGAAWAAGSTFTLYAMN